MKKDFIYFLTFVVSVAAIVIILKNPSTVTGGAVSGLIICANIIIPSLFPFAVIVFFITKSGCLSFLEPYIDCFTVKLFGLHANAFMVMLLSFIGGYPVGGKLIGNMVNSGLIDKKTARIMLCYCVNAGPAFVVIAVGNGILHSQRLGVLLLCAHLSASLLMALVLGRFTEAEICRYAESGHKTKALTDTFVESTADATASIITICAYVVLFSTITALLKKSGSRLIAGCITPLLEVTCGIVGIKNVYLIAALIGFGGLSVHCQVFSLAGNGKVAINKLYFLVARVSHALLSVLILFILLKIFPTQLPTISNVNSVTYSTTAYNAAVSLSLIITGVVLVAAVYKKEKLLF